MSYVARTCVVCGERFYTWNPRQFWCSTSCARRTDGGDWEVERD